MPEELPVLLFLSPAEWRKWLRANGEACASGIWMRLAKKNSAAVSLSYTEALEEALCYGWIDGQKKSGDADTWLQKFTPRRKKSLWSKINCARVEALTAAGRMQPSGLREVESARMDGRWERAYEPQSKIEAPDDFTQELSANPHAAAFFLTLNSVNRYAILHRIQTAKTPLTRAARIQKFVGMLADKRMIYPS